MCLCVYSDCIYTFLCMCFSQLQARLTVVEERLAVSKASEAALTAKLAAAEAEVSVQCIIGTSMFSV